jgi:hypothetical protein
MHTAEPLVREPSSFEIENATEMLKRCESAGTDQILVELIQAEGNTLRSMIHKFINSNWKKEEFLQQWKEPIIYLPIKR